MLSFRNWFRKLLSPRHQRHAGEETHASGLNRDGIALDPLVAARDHNIKNSRLPNLPDEILLLILESLGDDAVTLYCLRRVSRVFRRLIYEPRVWRRMRGMEGSTAEAFWRLSAEENRLMQRHLRRGGLCDRCKMACGVPVDGLLGKLVQTVTFRGGRQEYDGMPRCKFYKPTHPCGGLHCPPCGTHHDAHAFPPCDRRPGAPGKRCLGRRGAVQLCEHLHIPWAAIENHFAEWREKRPGKWDSEAWESCLDDFRLECHHPSHDMRCADEETPTWPAARLMTSGYGQWIRVTLVLEWEPHSGPDYLSYAAGGQAPVSELRELFRGYRRGAGEVLLPSYPSGPLPEMACYGRSECHCVYYGADDHGTSAPTDPLAPQVLSHEDAHTRSTHRHFRSSPHTLREGVLSVRHWPRGVGSPACLITTYRRLIPLFPVTGSAKVNPTHAWFHAMDPDTYARPRTHELPLCKDGGCTNYYRRPKVFRCDVSVSWVHSPCVCDTPEYREALAIAKALREYGFRGRSSGGLGR